MEPESWRVRRADLAFLASPEARTIVEEEGIILLDYRALQRVLPRQTAFNQRNGAAAPPRDGAGC